MFCTLDCLTAHAKLCPGPAPATSTHLRSEGRIEAVDLVCSSKLVEVGHMHASARAILELATDERRENARALLQNAV